MKTAPSSRGKVQKFLMNSRFAAVMKTVPFVSGEGPEVPDEFLLRCSVGNGSVVTWKGSEVLDEFLICCREEDGSVVTWEGSDAPDDISLLQC